MDSKKKRNKPVEIEKQKTSVYGYKRAVVSFGDVTIEVTYDILTKEIKVKEI